MLAGFLHAFKIFSETGVNDVGKKLSPSAVFDAALSVKEPLGNAVLCRLSQRKADTYRLAWR